MSQSMETGKRPTGLYRTGIAGLLVACGLVGGLLALKTHDVAQETRERKATADAGPAVKVQAVALSEALQTLHLEGEALPMATTTLYAKLSGYLRTISVDKGDRVRAGQTLAVIESPETKADYQSLLADAQNKRRHAQRAEQLGKDQLMSAQDVEQAQTDARVAEAKAASQAVQMGYQVVKAPFDGVVTARFADPGALVQNAAASQSSALPLVTVARVNRLRVTLYLDQRYAGLLHVGDPVSVSSPGQVGEALPARITRFSGELDLHTRMMLAEAELDNLEGRIVPGSFVQVQLSLKVPQRLEIPVEALLLRAGKPFVAVLGADSRVAIHPVTVGEENHQRLPVLSGLKAGERVILNLGDAAQEGALVSVTKL